MNLYSKTFRPVVGLPHFSLGKMTRNLMRLNKDRNSILGLESHSSVVRLITTTPHLRTKRDNKEKNEKYRFSILDKAEEMLNSALKSLPFMHTFYQQIVKGFKYQKEEYKIWRRVSKEKGKNPNYVTSYREQKSIFNIKASLLKSAALIPVFMLPMGFFLIFIPVALFPQYLLPRCYWTDKQRKEFLTRMRSSRIHHNGTVIHHLTYLQNNHTSTAFQRTLESLIDMVNGQKVPQNDDMLKLRQYCRNAANPLHIEDMPPLLLFSFCAMNFIWQYQPPSQMTRCLRRRVHLVLELDHKLREENLIYQLTDHELQDATFLRGLNTGELSKAANQYWLQNWVNHTRLCDDLDVSYILHAMVLQSYNYTELKYQRKVFG